jgi:Cu-processing system permease protein
VKPLIILAGKEIQRGIRNRWVVAMTLLMLSLSLSIAFLGSAPTGTVGASRLSITVVSLSSLTIFLIPLIALMLSYDAVIGEIENGTMLLLLSYPVMRWQVIAGKFLGHTAILALATAIGYGGAGLAVGLIEEDTARSVWMSLAIMTGSSVALGMTFLTLGYLISVVVRERGTAAGLAVAVWLVFVLLFDMGLLGVLVADKGATLKADVVNMIMLFNPADIYRMLNLSASSEIEALSGMTSLGAKGMMPPGLLITALTAWIAVPLGLAALVFQKREI